MTEIVKSRKRKIKNPGILFFSTCIFSLSQVSAQEAIPASGGEASGSGGSASYSVGQVVYATNTGTNGSVAQGVQQSFEISTETGMEEAKGINLIVSAYPNPATDFLTLSVDNFEVSNLLYQLYDINGKLLENKKLESNQTSIVMGELVPATYFLKVIEGNKEVKTFKIIKN